MIDCRAKAPGRFAAFCLALLAMSGCVGRDRYAPLSLVADGSTARLYGSIKTSSLQTVETFLNRHPDIDTLVFVDMPGSSDDETNLQIAYLMRARGLKTELAANSVIESGAVDLFLAGVERTAECGAQAGVHSWWDTAGYGPREIAPDHPDHRLFLDYYDDMGVPEAFYWFTVEAAPPEDIYYLTPDEMAAYKVVTKPIKCSED